VIQTPKPTTVAGWLMNLPPILLFPEGSILFLKGGGFWEKYLCLIVCLNSARFFCGARKIVYLYYKLYQDFAMDDVCRVEETLINNFLC
jgi:hypothetical protein